MCSILCRLQRLGGASLSQCTLCAPLDLLVPSSSSRLTIARCAECDGRCCVVETHRKKCFSPAGHLFARVLRVLSLSASEPCTICPLFSVDKLALLITHEEIQKGKNLRKS
ncbi:hypothetical protein BCV70DRAFT_114754 [Testicularia cyperi]|uniref:Uncharacterized protein n=1 Tax=Testicularia cyperi TaxID=1882483 RepID=A0A317XH76_9BASI|nr:hypothetical protein BCV70DRAFT_114754 [Testicularia cyperi]